MTSTLSPSPAPPKVRWQSRLIRILLMVLPPFTAVYLMQFVYGVNPWAMSFGVVLANALCVGVLYFVLCAATNRVPTCCFLIHLICGLWGAANAFVTTFRGLPILPWDFTALGTAADVAGSYRLIPTWRMWVGIALLVALWLVPRLLRRNKAARSSLPSMRIPSAAAAVVCLVLVLLPSTPPSLGAKADVWDQAGAYRKSGVVAAFLCNLSFMEVEEPDDTSLEALSQIVEEVEETPAASTAPKQQPNIIAIMNESWADFEAFGNLSLTESVMDNIHSLDNAIVGHAYTSVFGAGTSASEFEFLTGNSMAFLPSGSIPYQQYILGQTDSLASLLKEQGYRTVAFHPGDYTSWQRNLAYPRLGFDTYKCKDDMDVEQTFAHGGYVSDDANFQQVIYEFEHKEPGEPLFLFNVTIQNHGSYTDESYPTEVQLTDEPGKYPMAEQYLTLANQTDEAFRRLVEYFQQQEEPTIILMFGDHQPSVEQEFLDKAYGVTQDEMTMEQYMGKFQVPFVIWANFPLPDDGPEISSLNFLGQYLLHYAGVDTSVYGSFLWQTQETLPALTFAGYWDASGKAYSHLETNEYDSLIESYRQMQYNNLFGGDDRQGAYFRVWTAPAGLNVGSSAVRQAGGT